MKKRTGLAALSVFLFSASANALLIEGSFTATNSTEKVSDITGNIVVDYEPSRVTEDGDGLYNNGDSLINWIDITINELSMPLLSFTQAPELVDRLVLVDSATATSDKLELVDKASDTTSINTDELRRIELLFQPAGVDFLAGESIHQAFALDWSGPLTAGYAELKIFHRTKLGESIGTKTYSLTSLKFGENGSGPIATVPEPSSLILLGLGLGALVLKRRSESRNIS